MSGRVVHRPELQHRCAPGWTQGGPVKDSPGYVYAIPPDSREFPKGTVWECECGRRWVSTGPIAPNSPGFINFRPESWLERRRRAKLPEVQNR